MTRPKKIIAEKNNQVLPPIRCSESERLNIRLNAEKLDMSVSEYVRSMALNGKITIQQSRHDFELVDQLRRIGVNINQQTKKLNGLGKVSPELQNLWLKLDQLLNQILSSI